LSISSISSIKHTKTTTKIHIQKPKITLSTKMNAQVLASLIPVLERVRREPNMELEVRVGKLLSDGRFQAGYGNEHIDVIRRLTQRLRQTTRERANWTLESESQVMLRSFYPDNVRGTFSAHGEPSFCQKTTLDTKDVHTDFPLDLRVQLSRESPIAANLASSLQRTQPENMRILERTTIVEEVTLDDGQHLKFEYTVSKASPTRRTKRECCQDSVKYTRYHVEVELRDKLPMVGNPEIERNMNEAVAIALLRRACACLGTYRRVMKDDGRTLERLERLPPPTLSL